MTDLLSEQGSQRLEINGETSQDDEVASDTSSTPVRDGIGDNFDLKNRGLYQPGSVMPNESRPGDDHDSPISEIRSWGDFKSRAYRVLPLTRHGRTISDLLTRKRRSLSPYDRNGMHIDFFLALLFGETKDTKMSEYWLCTLGTMPAWRPALMKSRIVREINTIFRGFGNMVFCNNPISGILVITAMYIDHPFMATCSLLGVCGSTWTGRMIGADSNMVDSGIYSYNGLLCGFYIALFSYKGPAHWELFLLVNCYLVGSLSSVFMMAMSNVLAATYHVSPLSLPYILSVMLFVGATYSSTYWPPGLEPMLPVKPDRSTSLVDYDYLELFLAVFRGISVAQTVSSGILMSVAACICSPILAIAGILGGFIGYAGCVYMGVPPDQPFFYSGLYSYNCGLTAQAMMMYLVPTGGGILYTVFCCFAVAIAHIGLVNIFKPIGLQPGTLAMNIVGISFLLTQLSVTFIVPVPLELATIPEDHIRQYQRMKRLVNTLLLTLRKRSLANLRSSNAEVHSHHSEVTESVEKLQQASKKIRAPFSINDTDTDVDLIAIRLFMRKVSRDGSLSISQDDISTALANILKGELPNWEELRHALEDLWRLAGKKSESDKLSEEDICIVMNLRGEMASQTRELRCFFDSLDVDHLGKLGYTDFTDAIEFFPSQVCQDSKCVLKNEIYKIFRAEAFRRLNEADDHWSTPSRVASGENGDEKLDVKKIRLTFGQFFYHICDSKPNVMHT